MRMLLCLLSTLSLAASSASNSGGSTKINFSQIGATAILYPRPGIFDGYIAKAENAINHHHQSQESSLSDCASTPYPDVGNTDEQYLKIDLRSEWFVETVRLRLFNDTNTGARGAWLNNIQVYSRDSKSSSDLRLCGLPYDDDHDGLYPSFNCSLLHRARYIFVYQKFKQTTVQRPLQVCELEALGVCAPCQRPSDTATMTFLARPSILQFVCGSRIIPFCRHSFHQQSYTVLTCHSGKWYGLMPKCKAPRCRKLPPTSNGLIHLTNGNKLGSTATVRCKKGFSLSGTGHSYAHCISVGKSDNPQWNSSLLTCTQDSLFCNCPDPPAHGRIICPDFVRVNSSVLYVCNDGYERNTIYTEVVCMENQTWSREKPTCQPVKCMHIPWLANGKFSTINRTFGSRGEFMCDNGYEIRGRRTYAVCNKTGMWTIDDPPPVCHRLASGHCPQLERPTNGDVVYDNNAVNGSKAYYRCDPGYELIQDSGIIRTCLVKQDSLYGQWTGSISACRPRACSPLKNPVNGTVLIGDNSYFFYSHTLEYSCDDGYRLMYGDKYRTCTATGQWSGVTPICQHVCAGSENLCGPAEECTLNDGRLPRCQCMDKLRCPSHFESVCGNNGQSYPNKCLMAVTSCQKYNSTLRVAAQGPCQFGGRCYSQRPQAPPGIACHDFLSRSWFNSTSGQCEHYYRGSCFIGTNNFYTAEDCRSTCAKTQKICLQPRNNGRCTNPSERFYYNSTTGSCDSFVYNGCFGNENNFQTHHICEAVCLRDKPHCSCPPKVTLSTTRQSGITDLLLKVTSARNERNDNVFYKAKVITLCHASDAVREDLDERKKLKKPKEDMVVWLFVREKTTDGCVCPSLLRGRSYHVAVTVGQAAKDYIPLTLNRKFYVVESNKCKL